MGKSVFKMTYFPIRYTRLPWDEAMKFYSLRKTNKTMTHDTEVDEKETHPPKTVEEVANKLIDAGKQRADWFEPDAEVILATSAKKIAAKALLAQNQAAEERLREERKRVSRFLVERGERADDYDEYVRAVEQAELDQDVSK